MSARLTSGTVRYAALAAGAATAKRRTASPATSRELETDRRILASIPHPAEPSRPPRDVSLRR